MVKVWKDAIFETYEVPSNLESFKGIMESVPKFDKTSGGKKVYQKKEFSVYKVSDGFVVHNTKRKFEDAHTHLHSFNMAKILIDCAITKKLPKTRSHYLLRSVIRISTDDKYKSEVRKLLEVRENKSKKNYVIKR